MQILKTWLAIFGALAIPSNGKTGTPSE